MNRYTVVVTKQCEVVRFRITSQNADRARLQAFAMHPDAMAIQVSVSYRPCAPIVGNLTD